MSVVMAGMMGAGLMAAGGGVPVYLTSSADFDGTNDYMTRGAGLTGAADSKVGILSFWHRMDGGDGAQKAILAASTTVGGASSRQLVFFNGVSNRLQIVFKDAADATVLNATTGASFTTSASWHHFLISWNLATSQCQIYVDDIVDTNTPSITNANIDYTLADWSIGAQPNGSIKLNGCLAEFYFNTATSLDLSVVDNRRKFRSVSGKPVDLGVSGSTPTGSQPIIYQKIASGGVASDFATNLGSGGNLTVTGSLDLGSTSPSD